MIDKNDYQHLVNLSQTWIDKTKGFDSAFIGAAFNVEGQKALNATYEEPAVEIKFKKTHPNAKLPTKAYSDLDNCWDLYCCEDTTVPASYCDEAGKFMLGSALVPVGLQVAYVTPGFGFATKQKSGLAFKHFIIPVAGEMDSNYRGDFAVKLINLSSLPYSFKAGDKITQFKVEKIWKTKISFSESVETTDCGRGEGGFGSSGR
jgi:dUTP pyrophosphatase